MKNLRNETRLVKWVINRLENRRVRGYFIEMYKFVNGLDEIISLNLNKIKWGKDQFLPAKITNLLTK